MFSNEMKNAIVLKVVSSMNPLKIILFGSYAYGQPDKDSDLDLAIIMQNVSSKHKESVRAYKLLKDLVIQKDIIVVSEDEFEFYKKEPGSVYKTINDKGIVLYAR